MNGFLKLPIRYQLRCIIVIMALPVVAMIIHASVQQRRDARAAARFDTQKLADAIAYEQMSRIASARQLMMALSQLPEVRQKSVFPTTRLFQDILASNPDISNIFVADTSGLVWATAVPTRPPFIISDRRYFRNALETGRLSSGEYVVSRAISKPTINIGYPVRDDRGSIIGVISIGFLLEKYAQLLQRSNLPEDASFILLDHKGVFLFRGIESGKYVGRASDPELFRKLQEEPDEYTNISKGFSKGDDRIITTRKLRLAGEATPYMYIRVGIPLTTVLAGANKRLLINLSIFCCILVGTFIFASTVGERSVVARIVALKKASQALSDGDLNVRASETVTGGELGQLATCFDEMADRLARRGKSLQESEKRYQMFTNLTSDYVYSCSSLGAEPFRVRWMGGAIEKVTGYSQDEIFARGCWLPFLHPDDGERMGVFLSQLAPGDRGEHEIRFITKSGKVRWVRESSLCEAGNAPGERILYGASQDITERKEMERMKDEMISAVSHEMRTPLTAMLGYLDFILESTVDAVQMREYLGIVQRETEHLNELISNFLDMQRLQTREERHDFMPLALRPLLEDAAALFANASRNHRVTIDAPTELPLINGSRDDIQSLFNNLLSNALKYSPKGGHIVVGARRDERYITVWVKDEGIGIPQEALGKIFDRFYRIDNTDQRTTGGTGLGLALAKEIAVGHGGHIWVESTVGQGSIFYVSLPIV